MSHSALFRGVLALAVVGCAAACSRLVPLQGAAGDWPSGGRAHDEQRFSPLKQISSANVSRLGLAWSLDLPGEHALEATPLAVGGVLYFSGQMSKVYAVDGATGQILWTFDPQVHLRRTDVQRRLFPVSRGVAYSNGKVFVATRDGRLIALQARTGRQVWSVMTVPEDSKRMISGAPRVFAGKVLIGNNGGDFGERGYVTAYDEASGAQIWRFFTAPGNPAEGPQDEAQALAAGTWTGEWWKTGTGGTVWDSFTFDPDLNRVYIGTSNAGPSNPEVRSPGQGDNLFIASIVAVDADTGKYVWHYQVNPREAWDWKATQNIILAEMDVSGRRRRVLMQAPTNGFFYVIDRDTGKLVSAEKTGKVTWASHIDLVTGRPVEVDNVRYQNGPITLWPSPYGAHNWQPMAYSPQTGLAYIPYMKSPARYEATVDARKGGAGATAFGAGARSTLLKIDEDDGTGGLLAWDPRTQQVRWRVTRPRMWNGGVAATAGDLVFQGDAEGQFRAYDAHSGGVLWTFDAKLGITGAPISYEVAGRQYVSVLVGFGGGAMLLAGPYGPYGWKYGAQPRRLLTFALDATGALPPTPPRDFNLYPVDDPDLTPQADRVLAGQGVYYAKLCSVCHGVEVEGNGAPGPDLRESAVALSPEGLEAYLKSGAAAESGMPRYADISASEADALFQFIRARARAAKPNLSSAKPGAY